MSLPTFFQQYVATYDPSSKPSTAMSQAFPRDNFWPVVHARPSQYSTFSTLKSPRAMSLAIRFRNCCVKVNLCNMAFHSNEELTSEISINALPNFHGFPKSKEMSHVLFQKGGIGNIGLAVVRQRLNKCSLDKIYDV